MYEVKPELSKLVLGLRRLQQGFTKIKEDIQNTQGQASDERLTGSTYLVTYLILKNI